jgi:hypothetical protein
VEVRRVSNYEFSLRQEVLMEKGAAVLGDLFRYERDQKLTDPSHPVVIMYGLVWSAKQDILLAKSETELAQIEGQFDLANRFLNGIEVSAHVG